MSQGDDARNSRSVELGGRELLQHLLHLLNCFFITNALVNCFVFVQCLDRVLSLLLASISNAHIEIGAGVIGF